MDTKNDGGAAFPIPNVTACEWGGWLAVSPRWADVKIGVTANTEIEARMKFGKSYGEWLDILQSPRGITTPCSPITEKD